MHASKVLAAVLLAVAVVGSATPDRLYVMDCGHSRVPLPMMTSTRRAVTRLVSGAALLTLQRKGIAMDDKAPVVRNGARYDGIRFKRATIENVGIHYQEAGDPSRPHLLLLHGFPSTSRMWDRLIPTLAAQYHIIAPDYPGFGLSDAPSADSLVYTFDHIAAVMSQLVRQLGMRRYSIIMSLLGTRVSLAGQSTDERAQIQHEGGYGACASTSTPALAPEYGFPT
jgi:hypothetical protein